MKNKICQMMIAISVLGIAGKVTAENTASPEPVELSEQDFLQPPTASGPRTWWHWMSNNISKEGITKDLEAMKEMGLKGTQVFGMPQGRPFGDVDYLTPEWMEMSEHAAKESARLGLDLGFSNAIGCSGAGGPWITPELSMQNLVWTPPFRMEITPALRAGENEVEIRVTNLWRNRLVGDQKLPEPERTTWGFHRFYDADSPLAESGLLGPVTLLSSVDAKMTRKNTARD